MSEGQFAAWGAVICPLYLHRLVTSKEGQRDTAVGRLSLHQSLGMFPRDSRPVPREPPVARPPGQPSLQMEGSQGTSAPSLRGTVGGLRPIQAPGLCPPLFVPTLPCPGQSVSQSSLSWGLNGSSDQIRTRASREVPKFSGGKLLSFLLQGVSLGNPGQSQSGNKRWRGTDSKINSGMP